MKYFTYEVPHYCVLTCDPVWIRNRSVIKSDADEAFPYKWTRKIVFLQSWSASLPTGSLLVSLFPYQKSETLSLIGTERFFGLLYDGAFDFARSWGICGSREATLSN